MALCHFLVPSGTKANAWVATHVVSAPPNEDGAPFDIGREKSYHCPSAPCTFVGDKAPRDCCRPNFGAPAGDVEQITVSLAFSEGK